MADRRLKLSAGWTIRAGGSVPNLCLLWMEEDRIASLWVTRPPTRNDQDPETVRINLTPGELRKLAAAATELADRLES